MSREQRSKRERGHSKASAQRGLFDRCKARRETILQYTQGPLALAGCPLCGAPAEEHDVEPGPVPDDADLGEWILNHRRDGQA